MRVALTALGTLGDVGPILRTAKALEAQGQETVVFVNPLGQVAGVVSHFWCFGGAPAAEARGARRRAFGDPLRSVLRVCLTSPVMAARAAAIAETLAAEEDGATVAAREIQRAFS